MTSAIAKKSSKAQRVWFLLSMSLVSFIYLFFYVDGMGLYQVFHQLGKGLVPPDIFNQLAQAFLHGQLNLLTTPDPALLNLPDPYDNEAYAALPHLPDMSLFQGKYYAYYGPTNAMVLVFLHFLGMHNILDSSLVLGWSFGLIIVMVFFLRFFTQFSNKPHFFTLLSPTHSIIGYCFVLINVGVLFCLARPMFYEAAIMGGAFCFWLGMLMVLYVFYFLAQSKLPLAKGLLFVSSVVFGLSYFSRYNYGPAIFLVAMFITGGLVYYSKNSVQTRYFLSIFLTPLILTVLLSFVYNYARFGSIFETGNNYCLTSTYSHRRIAIEYGVLNFHHILPNFWHYFIGGGKEFVEYFPFAIKSDGNMPKWMNTPSYQGGSNHLGLLSCQYVTITLVLLLITVAIGFTRIKKAFFVLKQDREIVFSGLLSLGFLLIAIALALPVLLMISAETRYKVDFEISLFMAFIFLCEAALRSIKKFYSHRIYYIASLLSYTGMIASIVMVLLLSFEFIHPAAILSLHRTIDNLRTLNNGEYRLIPVEVKAASEFSRQYAAVNLLKPELKQEWASKSGKSGRVVFLFDKPHKISKIRLAARGVAFYEAWHYYQCIGYYKGREVFNEMRAAVNPAYQKTQTFAWRPRWMDKMVIVGHSPVLLKQEDNKVITPSASNPGFSNVDFYAYNRHLRLKRIILDGLENYFMRG